MTHVGFFVTFAPKKDKEGELTTCLRKAQDVVAHAHGCLHCVIGRSDGKIYFFEVWDTKEDHEACLCMPELIEILELADPLTSGAPKKIEFVV